MTENCNVNTDTKLMTQQLLSSNQSIESHACINETDRTIIALLLHENIIDLPNDVVDINAFITKNFSE